VSATRNRMVDRYLDDLRAALRELPKRQRDELVAEIQAHLDGTLPPGASDAEVLTALDRLGDPGQIAQAERERLGLLAPSPGWLEWLAIPLLLVGGVVLPVLGWIVGVVFLWLSRCWSGRDKLNATFLLPGGLLPAVYLLLTPTNTQMCESGSGVNAAGHPFTTSHCTGGLSTWENAGLILLELVLIIIPIWTTIRLLRRLPERDRPGPNLSGAGRGVIAALILGAILGGAAVWYYRSTNSAGHTAAVEALTGVATTSGDGSHFSFHRQSGDDPLGVMQNGPASFATATVLAYDDCHTGQCVSNGKTCLHPGADQPVEIGVIGAEAPSGETVFPALWVRCL